MRVVCIDVVIKIKLFRTAVLEELGRALWVAMVARLTFDARVIAVSNQHVAEALTVWFLIESLLDSPDDESA
jgi:hypothetical protein